MTQKLIAFVFILLLIPFFLCIYFILFFTLYESPIFVQERIGLNKKPFSIFKFKSMKNGSITKIGRVLRKLGLDELPQLFNIFKGDMNFVGPRPLTQFDIDRLSWDKPSHAIRWSIKPGITGMAQLTNVCDKEVSWKNDCLYIQRRSAWLDLKLTLKSLIIPIIGKSKQP